MSLLSEGSQPTDALLRAASRLAGLAWPGLGWAGTQTFLSLGRPRLAWVAAK